MATEIHDDGDDSTVPTVSGIPTVPLGKTVYDQATVTGPTSGTVSFVWYETGTCFSNLLNPPAATTKPVRLSAGTTTIVDDEAVTVVDESDFAEDFTQTPATAGLYSFRAR